MSAMIQGGLPFEIFNQYWIPWDQNTQVYTAPQQAQWSKWLNGFFVHNTGTSNLIFGSDRLQPGDSKSFGGNRGEIYRGRLDFFFENPAGPGPFTNEVRITQKYYRYPE